MNIRLPLTVSIDAVDDPHQRLVIGLQTPKPRSFVHDEMIFGKAMLQSEKGFDVDQTLERLLHEIFPVDNEDAVEGKDIQPPGVGGRGGWREVGARRLEAVEKVGGRGM